jgi:hypothetical protein
MNYMKRRQAWIEPIILFFLHNMYIFLRKLRYKAQKRKMRQKKNGQIDKDLKKEKKLIMPLWSLFPFLKSNNNNTTFITETYFIFYILNLYYQWPS